jgi:hypothetical protein
MLLWMPPAPCASRTCTTPRRRERHLHHTAAAVALPHAAAAASLPPRRRPIEGGGREGVRESGEPERRLRACEWGWGERLGLGWGVSQ